MNLLRTVDAADTTLIHYCHCVSKQIVELIDSLLRELHNPTTALTLSTHQECHRLHLVIVVESLLIVRKHTAYTTFTQVRSHTIVDTIVHLHSVSHLLGQATLQVHMVVDNREVLLLQTDDFVSSFIHHRHGIIRISYSIMETSNGKVLQFNIALLAYQCKTTLAQHLIFVGLSTVRLIRLSVANHICTIDLNRDILFAHSDIEVKPLAILAQRAIEVSYSCQATRLASTIDSTIVQYHFITLLAI